MMGYLLLSRDNLLSKINTDNLVVTSITEEEYNLLRKNHCNKITTHDSFIGIYSFYNTYKVYINDNENPIYEGSFSLESEKIHKLKDFRISLDNVIVEVDYIILVIKLAGYCRYEFDVPMVTYQILKLPLVNDISRVTLVGYTKEPVYIVNRDVRDKQSSDFSEDFPIYCVDSEKDIEHDILSNIDMNTTSPINVTPNLEYID